MPLPPLLLIAANSGAFQGRLRVYVRQAVLPAAAATGGTHQPAQDGHSSGTAGLSCPVDATAVPPDGLQVCCESAFLSHVRLRASWMGSQCPWDDLNIDVKIGIFAGSNLSE